MSSYKDDWYAVGHLSCLVRLLYLVDQRDPFFFTSPLPQNNRAIVNAVLDSIDEAFNRSKEG